MIHVRLTNQARVDIRELVEYIAKRNLIAARRYVSRLHESIASLGETPYVGRAREELGDELRSLPVGSHVVFYVVCSDEVRVLRVLHGSRDIEAVFGHPPKA